MKSGEKWKRLIARCSRMELGGATIPTEYATSDVIIGPISAPSPQGNTTVQIPRPIRHFLPVVHLWRS